MIQNPDSERSLMLANGNASAAEFLCLWALYCHAIDDVVDGDTKDAEGVIRSFTLAPLVFGHPFYIENISALRVVTLLVSNMYADGEAWKSADEHWRRQFADSYRHAGNEMVFAVALICGGYEHLRSVSEMQRTICYDTQHPRAAAIDERKAA